MNSIESQFVPYEIAVKLKDLGFDLDCISYYYKHGNSKKIRMYNYEEKPIYNYNKSKAYLLR